MSEEGASHLIPSGVFRLRFTCYTGFLSDIGCFFFFSVQRMCFEMRTQIVKTQASPQAFLDVFTQPVSPKKPKTNGDAVTNKSYSVIFFFPPSALSVCHRWNVMTAALTT